MSSHHLDDIDTVGDGVKARNLVVVARWNGNLSAFHANEVRKNDHFGIEVVVVLKFLKRHALEQLS